MAAAHGVLGASLIVLGDRHLACADHVRETGNDDPSECVIDELAGQWLACAFALLRRRLPLPAFLLAFLLFRLFDIWKPWPIFWRQTKLPGGLGVMTDDIVAGLMAGALHRCRRCNISGAVMFDAALLAQAGSCWTGARARICASSPRKAAPAD